MDRKMTNKEKVSRKDAKAQRRKTGRLQTGRFSESTAARRNLPVCNFPVASVRSFASLRLCVSHRLETTMDEQRYDAKSYDLYHAARCSHRLHHGCGASPLCPAGRNFPLADADGRVLNDHS